MTRILLITADLMTASQVGAAARAAGAALETRATLAAVGEDVAADLLLLDLQSLKPPPEQLVAAAGAVAATAGQGGRPRIVAFGPHVWRERLDAAVAAGADDAVSRGELLGTLPALLARWCG